MYNGIIESRMTFYLSHVERVEKGGRKEKTRDITKVSSFYSKNYLRGSQWLILKTNKAVLNPRIEFSKSEP